MLKVLISILFLLAGTIGSAQVKIRLFTGFRPESVFFSVTGGKYVLDLFRGDTVHLSSGEPVLIARYKGRLAVKTRNRKAVAADSLSLKGVSENASFSLRLDGASGVKRKYSGDLQCFADLGTILMVNNCKEEEYIAGVVKAEGGGGRNPEYFKTQAVLARTYMYKYKNKHTGDGFNLCDDTHCQAYSGICDDPVIVRSTLETRGMVVLDSDSVLIISAFHSNCGGETASSEDVWLTSVPYLKRIKDPYCVASRNSYWQKSYPGDKWLNMLKKVSHTGSDITLADTRFAQVSRLADYRAGALNVPLRNIRSELNLRSTYFSVTPSENEVILKGRGYGHGVGLCQEGAMEMASRGFSYRKIIEFYYSGVHIADIKEAAAEKVIK